MPYSSNLPAITQRMKAATDAGLIAAAQVVINKVKQELAGGYISGDFVTGHVMNSVTRSEPERDERGAFILVGSNVPYALFYEIGHFNIFRRAFTRVEIWWPAFVGTRVEQLAAFQRVYQTALGGGAGGFGRRAASPRSPDTQ